MKLLQKERFVRALKVLGKIAVVGLITFAILTFIGLQYSAKSEFCKICHYMVPYYTAWKTSSHNMVPCVECHYPPSVEKELKGKIKALTSVVQYFTGTYGKGRPWVEISDNSCLREGCHNRRLLSGRANFGRILFDHTPHLTEMRRGKKLKCTSCHSQIVQREHMTVTNTTCFLCHFKNVEGEKPLGGCPSCHGAPTSVIEFKGVKFDHKEVTKLGVDCIKCHINVVQGQGEISKERCFSCHTEPERLNKYQDVFLMHEYHVSLHKVDCLRCHEEIKHKIMEMTKSIDLECGLCHPDHHLAQKELFLGMGGKGVEENPDPMFLTQVSCTGCHTQHKGDNFKGKTAYANEAACMSCHGTKYSRILGQWKEKTRQILSVILPSLESSKKELISTKKRGESFLEAEGLVREAEENINLVKEGKGVHNIKYSIQLLEKANENLGEAMRVIGSRYKPLVLPLADVWLGSECFSCHLGIEQKETKVFGRNFPHKPHLLKANLGCEKCHSNENFHGELLLGEKSCDNCHHSGEKLDCSKCHNNGPIMSVVYKSFSFAHDKHVGLGLGCDDCHQSAGSIGKEDGKIGLLPNLSCYDCHHPLEGKECNQCHKDSS